MIKAIIIDDERLFRENLKRKINRYHDFEVVAVAKNGIEGQLEVEAKMPDVIFTDIRMPGRDGLEFLSYLRKSLESNSLVVLISGYPNFEYARKALRLGAFDYLTKPIIEDELNNVINRIRVKIGPLKNIKEENAPRDTGNIIEMAKEFIRKNFKDATLEEAANYVRMNPSSFSRKFKNETGITFIQFLTDTRMDIAKKLIKNPIMKISEVSHYLGYKDPYHFSRIFKKYTGFSPEEYRKNCSMQK